MAAESGKIDPMHQFQVEPLFGQDWSIAGHSIAFTNSSLWMAIAIGVIAVFMFVGTAKPQIVPGRWQAAVEYVYDFVRNMLAENVGPEGKRYAPLIFAVFMFVLVCNLLGLLPWVGAFTPTSHISVTIGLAFLVFIEQDRRSRMDLH